MKRFLAIALVGTIGLIYSGTASASGTHGASGNLISGYAVGMSANGIGMSRHNFGAFGEHVMAGAQTDGQAPPVVTPQRGTTEICVFCHTPHHSRPAAGPLWNRGAGAAETNYVSYGTTIGGNTADTVIHPESAACLSCHDGITTFDMLVNSPGKGFTKDNFTVFNSGSNAGFQARNQGWLFTEKAVGTGGFGDDSRLCIGCDPNGSVASGDADLTNDHPIGITYDGGNVASLRGAGTVISSILLREDLQNGNAIYDSATFDNANLTQNNWSVNGFISNSATIGDLLKGATDTVECGSCHDPHFSNKSWGEYYGNPTSLLMGGGWKGDTGAFDDSDGLFLRRVGGNTGSGLCRTCHDK